MMDDAKEELLWACSDAALARGETFFRVLSRTDIVRLRSSRDKRWVPHCSLGLWVNPLDLLVEDDEVQEFAHDSRLAFVFETFDPVQPHVVWGTCVVGDRCCFMKANHGILTDWRSDWDALGNVFSDSTFERGLDISTALLNTFKRKVRNCVVQSKTMHAMVRQELAQEIAAKSKHRLLYRFDDWL